MQNLYVIRSRQNRVFWLSIAQLRVQRIYWRSAIKNPLMY